MNSGGLEKLIAQLSLRMRHIKALQGLRLESSEGVPQVQELGDREAILLETLAQRKKMNMADVRKLFPNLADSTISTVVTRLAKGKALITKGIDPDNQRARTIELSDEGHKMLEAIQAQTHERLTLFIEGIKLDEVEERVLWAILERAISSLDLYLDIVGSSPGV